MDIEFQLYMRCHCNHLSLYPLYSPLINPLHCSSLIARNKVNSQALRNGPYPSHRHMSIDRLIDPSNRITGQYIYRRGKIHG